MTLSKNGVPLGVASSADVTAEAASRVSGDAATLASAQTYADATVGGLLYKAACRVVATSNVASLSGYPTIDGVTIGSGDTNKRVLLTAQSTTSQNGPWVTASGAWARPSPNELQASAAFPVAEGTVNHDTLWYVTTNDPITPGATSIVVVQAVTGFGNPMTTAGDSIVGGVAGVPTRLALGTATQLRRVSAGGTAEEFADGGAVLADQLTEVLGGEVAGTTFFADGAGGIATTSAPVSALLASATLAAMQAVLGVPAAPIGPFTATANLSDTTSLAEPALGSGTTIACCFWKRADTASERVIAYRVDDYSAQTRGWYFGVKSNGKFFLSLGLQTIGGIGQLEVGDYNALTDDAPHAIAITLHDLGGGSPTLRYSIDGAAVVTVAATGTYAVCQSGDALRIGASTSGGFERPFNADLQELLVTSTEVSDADLALLSVPALPLATVATGTLAFDLDAALDFVPGYACRTSRGSQLRDLTVNGGLTRRRHA